MRERIVTIGRRASLVAGLAVLAGCGVEHGVASPQRVGSVDAAVVARAAASTQEASSYQLSVEMDIDADGADAVVRMEGRFDQVAKRGAMDMEVDAPTGGLLPQRVTMAVVVDQDAAYVRSDAFGLVDPDRPWIRVPLGTEGVISMGAARPDASFGILEELGGEVDDLGREEVRGVDTQHLRTQLRLADLLEQADPERRDRIEQQFGERGLDASALDGPSTVEAWIDDDGRVRRMRLTMELQQGGETATLVQTMEMFDFGEPVDIEVPSPDQVSDVDPSSILGD